MGTLIRSLLLATTLIGFSVLGVFLYKPSFIDRVDGRLQRLYVGNYVHEFEAIQGLEMPEQREDALARLRSSLSELGLPRKGEKRFSVWRELSKTLASHLMAAGSHREAFQVIRRVLEQDPLDVDLRIQLATSLHADGSEAALLEARVELEFLNRRVPNSVSVTRLQMLLAAQAGDWGSVAQAFLQYEKVAAREFLAGWQAFAITSGDGLMRTPLLTASPVGDSKRSHLSFEFGKVTGSIKQLRLDPPTGNRGLARDLVLVVKGADGQTISGSKLTLKSQVGMHILEGKHLYSDGGKDPRCRYAVEPALELEGPFTLEVTFTSVAELPVKVEALVDNAGAQALLREALESLRKEGN